jgi:hypothetical protein
MAGLEQNTGNYIVIDYVTGYQTKGNASTKEWSNLLRGLEDMVLLKDKDKDKDGNTKKANTTMKQLVGKHMHQIAKSQDVSKEEASFCLAGGQLKYNSMVVKTCSLNQVGFSDFESKDPADSDAAATTSSGGWTYLALRKRYKEYG